MKKILSVILVITLLICSAPMADFAFDASAVTMTLEEVQAEMLQRNKTFAEYAKQSIFDMEYFRTPLESETDRADYEAKAKELTSGLATDYEKVQAIYDWVRKNIYYDNDYIADSSKGTYFDAHDVYAYGRTVCEGYASLLVEMCRCVGIPARKAEGLALSNIYTDEENIAFYENRISNHAWAEVYVDGRWIFCDATWDSGNIYQNGEKYTAVWDIEFFDLTVEQYSKTHLFTRYETYFSIDGMLILVGETTSQIVDYVGDGDLTISSDGRLTRVDPYSFFDCLKLKNVVIDDGFTSIERSAFCGCENLKTITIPVSVKSIAVFAFGYSSDGGNEIKNRCDVETVYYEGTEKQWNEIEIGANNYGLENAEIIFLGKEEVPTTTEPTTTEPTTTEPTTTEPTTTELTTTEPTTTEPTTTEPTTTEPTTTEPTTTEPTTTEPTTTEPTTTEPTTTEPEITEDDCSCMCHEGGFKQVIYIIVRLFWLIFGINKGCDCGRIHY